jgi:hypothetical protein
MKTFLYSFSYISSGVVILAKKKNTLLGKIGPWAFVFGLIIAIVSAVTKQVFWALGVLGVIVGLMNVSDKELSHFLLASLTFLVSANALSVTLGKVVGFMPLIEQMLVFVDPLLANLVIFVAPGASIVALKALYNLAKD